MLETRLVVDDHVFIVSGILVDLGLENAVDKAVAALALRSSHDEHVEIVFFDERGIELHLRVIGLCHVGRNRALLLGSCHFLADVSERGFDLHAEHLVEVGVCVRIHNEDGTLFLLAQIIDDHAAGGRLADATPLPATAMVCVAIGTAPLKAPYGSGRRIARRSTWVLVLNKVNQARRFRDISDIVVLVEGIPGWMPSTPQARYWSIWLMVYSMPAF